MQQPRKFKNFFAGVKVRQHVILYMFRNIERLNSFYTVYFLLQEFQSSSLDKFLGKRKTGIYMYMWVCITEYKYD